MGGLAYVVLAGSVGVFALYVFVLRYWAAPRAAYGFVIIPLVTVALSTWLGDEPITPPSLVVGGLLVVVGVYIGALRPAHAEAREAT